MGYLCAMAIRIRFLLLLVPALAAGNPKDTPPAVPGAAASRAPDPLPLLRVFLGPDGNACGITPAAAPAGKPRRAGLIVWLHGGMRGGNRRKGLEAHRALIGLVPSGAYHLCSPSAFGGEEWPTARGLAHIDALIGYMLARYPVDSGDVNMVGVSDGCLGVIAYSRYGKYAVNRRVLVSSFPRLVLPLDSLAGRERFAKGSWDFLQGGRDRLFPADQAVPYLRQWEKLYPNARLHFFPDGEHDFSFYAEKAPDLLKNLFSGNRAR